MSDRNSRLPIQAPPVVRSPALAGRSGELGIEPSDFWSDLWNTVQPALPGIIGGLGSLFGI